MSRLWSWPALVLVGLAIVSVVYGWSRLRVDSDAAATASKRKVSASVDGSIPVRVGKEARKNMSLVSAAIEPTTYTQTIDVPGIIVDRPGVSDRGVIAPITGIITQIHAYPGSLIAPNTPLFSLRLVSETLQTSQLELFKSTKEIDIARQQKQRLEGLAQSGAVPATRLIELDNQIQRMEVNIEAYRQGLRALGLSDDLIDASTRGEFAREYVVYAPSDPSTAPTNQSSVEGSQTPPFNFEVHALRVELGQQVAAGELLCSLADHRLLLIEGRGFKRDMAAIQHAAMQRRTVRFTLEESDATEWPALDQLLPIQNVANSIDAKTRTFSFYLPLENQWKAYEQAGVKRLLWRFRPGDHVRLLVPIDVTNDVYVLPQGAIVREGPNAYVFRQNGDLFDRISVHIVHEDRLQIAIANDGSLRKGSYIAQNSAASLNRVMKAQLASGQPNNVHVHADGTTHENH